MSKSRKYEVCVKEQSQSYYGFDLLTKLGSRFACPWHALVVVLQLSQMVLLKAVSLNYKIDIPFNPVVFIGLNVTNRILPSTTRNDTKEDVFVHQVTSSKILHGSSNVLCNFLPFSCNQNQIAVVSQRQKFIMKCYVFF